MENTLAAAVLRTLALLWIDQHEPAARNDVAVTVKEAAA